MNIINKIRGDKDCYSYRLNWWNFFIPSINIFSTICESSDKTYMFIMDILRITFYSLLLYFIIKLKVAFQYEYVKQTLISILIVFIFINVLLLIYTFFKRQYIQKKVPERKYIDENIFFPTKMHIPLPKTDAELYLDALIQAEANAKAELLAEIINKWEHDKHLYEINQPNILFNHIK